MRRSHFLKLASSGFQAVAWAIFLSVALPEVVFSQTFGHLLLPASSVTETLAGNAEADFEISVPANQTLELQIVEHGGDPGLFRFFSADGKEFASLDTYRRRKCVERALVPPGAVRIKLEPLTKGGGDRVFEIRTGPLGPLDEAARLRISAERLLSEGERIRREEDDPRPAIAPWEKSRAVWAQLSDRMHEGYALLQIGSVEQTLEELKAAKAHSEQAVDLWSNESSCMGEALRQLASIENQLGEKGKAEEHAARALTISRSLHDDTATANNLLVEGQLLEAHGQLDRARENYTEAYTLAREVRKRFVESDALMFLAVLEHNRAHWKESIDATLGALAISKEDGDEETEANALNGLAANYRSMGEIRKSIEYSEQAVEILRRVRNPSRYGNALYNLATCYAALDDYPKALRYYNEALPIFQKAKEPMGQGYILMGLAQVHRTIGDDERADSYFRRAAVQWQKSGEKQDETFALNASGDLAARRRQFPQAIELYTQSLAIARASGFQHQEATTLAKLSEVYLSAKNARAAVDPATQSLAIARKIGDRGGEAAALYQQGRAWRALGESDLARKALEGSALIFESVGSRVEQARAAYELATLDRDQGLLPSARDRILNALDRLEQAGANAGGAEARMLFAASHRKTFDLAVDIAMRQREPARAFELSERARARSLVDLIRGARLDIREGVDPALLERERHVQELLDAKHDKLTRMLASSHAASAEALARKEVDDLVQQYRDVEGEIRTRSPRYAALIQPHALAVGDVQEQLLDPHTAILDFWIGDERSYAWLVTKSDCQGFELPPKAEIERLARRAYDALNARGLTRAESAEQKQARVHAADLQFDRLSQELSHKLLGPMPDLSRFRRLWIISDGALQYLPFAALPLPGSTTPLVAAHEIVVLSSGSVAAEMRSEIAARRPAPLAVSIFADPVFRADDERLTNASARQAADPPRAADDVHLSSLPRLYFSRREADAIKALDRGGNSREILDFDASRAEVNKPALREYRVVHFATHALLDSKNPELSGLVLSMIDREGRPQDGFLRLHEVYNLKLNADLVVLSACRTALGADVRSEGMIGLTRGFMYAGVPQVLASLWEIRDNASAWFMTRFYEALLERRESPEAALRSAQLAMRKDPRWNQPYYWAAFTLQGAR